MSGKQSTASQRSSALYGEALQLIPGGVNSPVRAMRAIGREPIFVASGKGARITDVDGNQYVDYVCSWGPLIAGHAHPEVVAAVTTAAGAGTSYGAPTEREVKLAAEIVARVPSVERVRLTNSGTEATMSALRLARAATGRDKILKFAGGYHGHVDGLLAEAGSGMATAGVPASPGVTAAQAADTVIVPFNDAEALQQAIDRYGHELAAVIAEPIAANMGVVAPQAGFLQALCEAADGCGALLIFDEVITGFRVGRGGAQELYGVQPDLTVMGKVIGGGLPGAAFGGRRELMDMIAPVGDVYQAGTLSGNPLMTAAGLATLRLLDYAAYERLAVWTDRLANGLKERALSHGAVAHVASQPGLLTVFFSDSPIENYDQARACDTEAYGRFCRSLLEAGVYAPASQFEAWFPSLVHGDIELETTLAAADQAFAAAVGG